VADFEASVDPSLLGFAKTSLHSVAVVKIHSCQAPSLVLKGTDCSLHRSKDFAKETVHPYTAVRIVAGDVIGGAMIDTTSADFAYVDASDAGAATSNDLAVSIIDRVSTPAD
jgi:hypothetical protein